ncbi:MAG: PAS domain S-box protein [Phycisphaerales bacterium]
MQHHGHGATAASDSLWQFIQGLFNSSDFMPRAQCVFGRLDVIWLHVISDALIALSYYSIPIALIVFVRRRRDLAFNWIFMMFAAFILACGTTHIMSIIAFWYPLYRLDGVLKAGTGLISTATAVALWPLLPKAIALPSPAALRAKNIELESTAAVLLQTRDDLQRSHDELERRVAERTAQLAEANRNLQLENVARSRAEARLLESETRFKLALRGVPIVVFSQDRDLRFTWVYNSWLGLSDADVIGRTDAELCDPESARRLTALKRSVLDSAVGVREQLPITRANQTRVLDLLIEPLLDPDGLLVGLTGVALDITQQSRVKQELEFQKYALDQHAIVAITDNKGKITYVNDKFCAISQYSREELIGQDHRIVNSGFHPRTFFRDMYATVAAGNVWRDEIRNRAKDGSIYWVDTTIVPMRDADARITNYVAIRSDITGRKRAEENLRLLVAELDHRVKNNLSVVLSIAQATMRHSTSIEQFGHNLVGRIRALARTHSALAAARWEGASLSEILRVTLEAHAVEGTNRVSFNGPSLMLSHRAASVLSTTFNELATNASKYGALSSPAGRVCVTWQVQYEHEQSPSLVILWVESAGPPVSPPTRRGLGTQFIREGVEYELEGAVTLEFPSSGLRCRISIPCDVAIAGHERPVGTLESHA